MSTKNKARARSNVSSVLEFLSMHELSKQDSKMDTEHLISGRHQA